MSKINHPIPENETDRLLKLSDLDVDYGSLFDSFKDLTLLAAKVAGTKISLVNLIDAYTQWTIGSHGLDLKQMTREESVCQYTITKQDQFEVPDLSGDERFNKNFYVDGPLALRYYFGVPLKDNDGVNLGALCILDTSSKQLSPEKIELLKIIAGEVVNRIKSYRAIQLLHSNLKDAHESVRKVAHDIRGPLAGIIGLSEIINEQGNAADLEQVLDFIKLIHGGSKSLLDLADEILTEGDEVKPLGNNEYNLTSLRDKLQELYGPQALYKEIELTVSLSQHTQSIAFSKNRLLQIIGNVISNAVKFTPRGGKITVDLELLVKTDKNVLSVTISDTGVGIDQKAIDQILAGNSNTTTGTVGEKGYGFGLPLVKHLIDKLGGEMAISSVEGKGTTFRILLPQTNM